MNGCTSIADGTHIRIIDTAWGKGYTPNQDDRFTGYCQELVLKRDLINPGGYGGAKRLVTVPDPPQNGGIYDETAYGGHCMRLTNIVFRPGGSREHSY